LLKTFHIALAYITVIGFVLRGIWAIADSELSSLRWAKITPHVVDTLLLSLGIAMAISLQISPTQDWLTAKIIALLSYIGFGVVTMRAKYRPLKIAAFVLALTSVVYLISVAFTRKAMPFF
jgi:uncharacterized membrane protein SirB2